MEIKTDIFLGDSKEVLKRLSGNSVDLIVTSPPYADQRNGTYGGIRHDKYVDWFLPISEQLLRVIKPTGTFVLNIKEKVVEGERSTYVMELILEMRKQGWLWTEEFIWHKKNCYPGKWPNRFRDAWERLLQFNKDKKFNMYQDEVMVPMGDWSKSRLKNLSETDKVRDNSPEKGDYVKYCGQRFWEFISGSQNLFTDIIEPLGHQAKERNDDFNNSYAQMVNKFTKEFSNDFCLDSGDIDWKKLVEFNSKKD